MYVCVTVCSFYDENPNKYNVKKKLKIVMKVKNVNIKSDLIVLY